MFRFQNMNIIILKIRKTEWYTLKKKRLTQFAHFGCCIAYNMIAKKRKQNVLNIYVKNIKSKHKF